MSPLSEAEIRSALEGMPAPVLTAFAAACAEVLWPCTQRHLGRPADADARRVLDAVWDTAGQAAAASVQVTAADRTALEDLVPDDDDPDFGDVAALAQNSIAAMVYAAATTPAGSDGTAYDAVQAATWASRQVVEAADHAADTAETVAESPAPTLADEVIRQLLDGAATGDVGALLRQASARSAELGGALLGST